EAAAARVAAGVPPAEGRAPASIVVVVVAVLVRIEQLVGVDDEVAGEGVVDRRLRLRLPGGAGGRVVGIGADEVHAGQIAELVPAERLQLSADDQVQQLVVRHAQLLGRDQRPAMATFSTMTEGALAAPRISRSEPTTARRYMSTRLPATVISESG